MNIYLGSDHAGYQLKNQIEKYLEGKDGNRVVDLGVFNEDSADYPDIAHEVAEKVRENGGAVGILICGTGIGMCMAANKTTGIRAVNSENVSSAEMGRKHNNANMLCLGGRILAFDQAKEIVDTFMATAFDTDERHVRRVQKIDRPDVISERK